jgi:hypothetical protein
MSKTIFSILQRVLVNHFYKVNAGFFLFCFFVLFGAVSGGQLISYHLSLIHGMIGTFVFLSCVIVIWFLYTLKCVNYITKQLNDPRQHFLSVLNRLSQSKQFIYLLFVHVMVYLPVLAYAAIVASVAAKEKRFDSMAAVIISNLVMIILSAFVYRLYLQKRTTAFKINLPVLPIPKPFFSISLWFILKERKQMLLVTKLFSFFLLFAFINIYEPDKPDIRPLLLIMSLVVVAHAAIVAQIRFFEEERLLFIKNLPIPFVQRLGMMWLQYFLLLLPEFIFMWKGFPLHFQLADIPQIVLLSLAIAACIHVLLLMKDTDMETYYKTVFGIWAVLFFVLLYNPGIVLAVLILVVSSVIYHSHLYDFEKGSSFK